MSGETRLEVLAAELAPALLQYFVRRTDPPADAADLLSETLLVMTRRSADLPADDEQARMWAFGVARRVLSTHRRGKKRHAAMLNQLREHLWVQDRQPRVGDEQDRVLSALRTLPQLDQEIVRLIHWDGFSQVEVAKMLGRPPGTIRSRYARARSTLKAELQSSAQFQSDHEPAVASQADPSPHARAPRI
ncbi:RNA polymerase sigma factor [uncultured Serinicoccus sp.]|uniref:RNA polymerase sigma factor n=1 Tax=uncultured Serinicoccus sp. TaxID=735514 RepID=UPI0026139420|nr:sigma-70 family RNA polymerase sigma factor [uncultured Serinicoccus sp.]